MHKNLWWQAFLIAVFLIVLWYSGTALYRTYNYSRLTAKTTPTSIKWDVLELSDDEFVMEGNYTFEVKGKTFEGNTPLKNSIYKNRWAVEEDLPKMDKVKWGVWYNPSNPDYSSLQKKFPVKECLSAVFMWVLFLYFLWLGFYVSKFRT